MPRYADGFVIVIAKKNLKAYEVISKKAGKVWKEHGALEYLECVGDDLDSKFGTPFPKLAKVKRNETVVFSWILYKSRAHHQQHAVRHEAHELRRLQRLGRSLEMRWTAPDVC